MILPEKYLDPGIFGYALQSGYNQAREASYTQLRVLSGKARYRLRNPMSNYIFTLNFDWSDYQLWTFETLWNVFWNHGTDWFYAPIMFGEVLQDKHPQLILAKCHAVGQYTARSEAAGRWSVSLEVETNPMSWGPMPDIVCPIIYGGPLDFLSPDDISSETVDDLPTGIIEPCLEVFGG